MILPYSVTESTRSLKKGFYHRVGKTSTLWWILVGWIFWSSSTWTRPSALCPGYGGFIFQGGWEVLVLHNGQHLIVHYGFCSSSISTTALQADMLSHQNGRRCPASCSTLWGISWSPSLHSKAVGPLGQWVVDGFAQVGLSDISFYLRYLGFILVIKTLLVSPSDLIWPFLC